MEKEVETKEDSKKDDKEMSEKEKMMIDWHKKKHLRIFIFGFALVVIMIGFAGLAGMVAFHHGGRKFERNMMFSSQSMMNNRGFRGQGFKGQGKIGGGFYGARLSGTVSAINGNNLIVKDSNGKEYTAIVSDQTSYIKAGDIAKQSDLAVNNFVMVSGPANSQGQITAQVIRIK